MKHYFMWPTVTVLLCAKLTAQQEQDSINTLALEEVVVSDSRFELKRENSGKTVIKISRQELERNQGQSVAALINTKSGIEINGTRSFAGQNLSTYVRGGNNRQVLVVIDGIQVSDPSGTNGEYDLRLLNPSQIESIEILKGAASTLYGNSAATAVINITTKQAMEDGIDLEIRSNLGTNQSQNGQDYNISDFSNTATISGKTGKWKYLASGGHQFTNGLSSAIGTEPDTFSRIDGNVKIGYQFTDKLDVTASAFYNKLSSDYDNGYPIEDAKFYFTGEQSRFGVASNYKYENGTLILNTAFNQIDRAYVADFPSAYDSQSYVLDVFNKYAFAEKVFTIIGLNYIENQTQFTESFDASSWDPYLNLVYVGKQGINLNTGVRLNNHSTYGSHFIYNINPSYRFRFKESYVKVFGSFATSYIAPNLSQLYGPFGPNPNLNPEENSTWEGGLEVRLSDKFTLSSVYFNRTENDRILYTTIDPDTFESQYRNSGTVEHFDGIEVTLKAELIKDLLLTTNYTYTNAKEGLALRVPKNKVNASLGYAFNAKTYASLSYQYISDRKDTDFATFSQVTLDPFHLFDARINHTFTDQFAMFLSVTNVFNEDYVEVVDFTTKGRNVHVGFSLKL